MNEANEQSQNNSPKKNTSDCENEQLKNENVKLKEALSQFDNIRQKAMDAETQILSLQKSNSKLTQQINDLTVQNSQLIMELAAFKNPNFNGNPFFQIYNQPNNLIPNNFDNQSNFQKMQEKYQQEIAFRDDLIEKLRANAQLNSPPASSENANQKKSKKNLKGKAQKPKTQLNANEKENINSNMQISTSDKQLLEQKYLKKKNKLILMKQQYEELEEESQHQLKKTKSSLEEVRQKFHLLKKKYNDLKEDFSSLQVCYQAVVQKAETLSAELQNSSRHRRQEEYPPITVEDPKISVQSDDKEDIKENFRQKAEKAEQESAQLRCLLQIMANNESNFNKLNSNNKNIIRQLESLGIKIDRLDKKNDDKFSAYSNKIESSTRYAASNQDNLMKRKSHHDACNHRKYKIELKQNLDSNYRNRNTDEKDSVDDHKNDDQESVSSRQVKNKQNVKKEDPKFPHWRKFQDI